jgi:hypothetical protein
MFYLFICLLVVSWEMISGLPLGAVLGVVGWL